MNPSAVPVSAVYWKPFIREKDLPHFSREGFRGAVNDAIREFLGASAPVHFHHHGQDEEFTDGFVQYRLVRHPRLPEVWVPAVIAVGTPAVLLGVFGEHLEKSRSFSAIEVRNMGLAFEVTSVRRPFDWKPAIQRDPRTYELKDWLPLSPKNKREYESLRNLVSRVQMLDRIVEGNIRRLLGRVGREGLAADVNAALLRFTREVVEKAPEDVWNPDQIKLYGQSRNRLDVVITANLNIPEEICIGQGATLGFGQLTWLTKRQKFDFF